MGKRRNVQDQRDHKGWKCWGAAGTRISKLKALGQQGLQSAYGIQAAEQSAQFGEQPYMFNALPHILCFQKMLLPLRSTVALTVQQRAGSL